MSHHLGTSVPTPEPKTSEGKIGSVGESVNCEVSPVPVWQYSQEIIMSWDSYIDNLIGQTQQHASHACILGLDGAKWTSDGHAKALKISNEEAATICKCFKTKKFDDFAARGVVVNGVKFTFLRAEEEKLVYAKKKDHGGLTLQATKTALVIGFYPEGKQAGNVNKGVAVISEYLESMNM